MGHSNIKKHTPAFQMTYIMFFTVFLSMPVITSACPIFSKSIINDEIANVNDNKNIKSILLHCLGFELSDPIIELNTDEKLLLSFDDLEDEVKSYSFKIQHCNSNWEASDLMPNEYVDGFLTDQINDYQFSLNTTTPYIHYELVFPTEYLRLTKSGNYIISVFADQHENDPVFVRKFHVLQPKVKIEATVKPPLSIRDKMNKQEIGFKILLDNLYVPNPDASLKIVITQNHGTGYHITDLKPVRNQGTVLDYNFNNKSVFYGGNEFRPLNIKSLKYKSERINAIEYFSDGYHVTLRQDQLKDRSNYILEHDINGQKLIKTEDDQDSSTEANYTWVHFKLQAKPHLLGKSIYLIGKLVEGLSFEDSKMNYNAETNTYEGLLFLKQGYYDYQYRVKEPGLPSYDTSLTEGSHYETNNEYSIFVYYRAPGTLYDQMIGADKFSGPIN